jgi:hypothetical protein
MNTNKEELFPEEPTTTIPALIPTDFPGQLPDKQAIRAYRADLVEELTGRLGPLKAYVLVKLIENIVAHKDEGLIKHIKDDAQKELEKLLENETPGVKEIDFHGVRVSVKGRTYYDYPAHVNELEVAAKEADRKWKGAKKAAEIDGSAAKMHNPSASITVTF